MILIVRIIKGYNTALHFASGEGHINTVEMLLDRGIDIKGKSNSGTTLHKGLTQKNKNLYTIDNFVIDK